MGQSKSHNRILLHAADECGSIRLDGKRDERRPDDTKHELELGPVANGRWRRPADVRSHPRLYVGAECPVAPGAGVGNERLLGDGHLEDGVQSIFSVQVRPQLPHGS